ncbi:DsbE family thiol:disulfide interchange protein [Paenirhodobacter populi]|uniref:DsbE family thiol:disulfide interchange protein n=1 Tax=Paenirhodobacter populi TaxID=2306993 RepID=A0A443K500_9RHOB|nr:DsbE family thiol:disulfide interchange protein [Sinirhodobacter populi]RWR06033.1 DsbE family thiol:disulfide interchange protein [Sinirhodobacter populi]RWR27822.1 DsbE family thiol:disulfide interchange protein [Sinirhodobacter populi]
MARPLMFLPPLIFAGLAATFWWGMQRQNPEQLPTAFQGKPAPAVRLDPLPQGQVFDDADLRDGKIKLVNFWASWCAPCRVEHPQLESLAKEGVTILGVNYKDDPDKAQGFLDDMGNPFARMGADPKGQMALNWGVYGVPETFVVDGEGTVIFRFAGPVTPEVAEDQIEPLLAGDGE